MGRKSRENLTNLVNQNIHDNTQKEILASMVREVLKEYRDSHFNWISDELKKAKYNSTQTLEQYLNAITGSVPRVGRIDDIDVGNHRRPLNITPTEDDQLPSANIIQSAKYSKRSSKICEIEITVISSIDLNNRTVIPVLRTSRTNYKDQTTLLAPVIRVASSNKLHVGFREIAGKTQSINLEIVVL